MRSPKFFGLFLVGLLAAGASEAASLRVSPVMLDLRAPAAVSTLRVWNEGAQTVAIQIRVFRWTQKNGQDVLEPTRDVVASPPVTSLKPGGENVVRIVRAAAQPVRGEESYRVMVDELPDPSRQRAGAVTMLVRHSIPAFFAADPLPQASVSWTARRQAGGVLVTARNVGGKRMKVANLALADGPRRVAEKKGLVGYVLGGSSASWLIPARPGAASGRSLGVSLEGENGRVTATVQGE